MPQVNNAKEYGDRWNTWWWSMQPSWRDPESPLSMPSEAKLVLGRICFVVDRMGFCW